MDDAALISEESGWQRFHTLIFMAFAVGASLEGFIYALSYVATSWVTVPRILTAVMVIWPPLWLLAGYGVSGPMADAIGRKKTFFVTFTLYMIGGLSLIASYDYITLLFAISVLLVAAGADINMLTTTLNELMPRIYRGRSLFLTLNFVNLGGIAPSVIAIMLRSSPQTQKLFVGAAALLVTSTLLVTRLKAPESIMWLQQKGSDKKAADELSKYYSANTVSEAVTKARSTEYGMQSKIGTGIRIAVSSLSNWAFTAGFSLGILVLGPYFFSSMTNDFIFVGGGIGFLAGLSGLFADKISRRYMLLASTALVMTVSAVMLLTVGTWSSNPTLILFWALIIIFSAAINIQYLSASALSSEIWPTHKRGTLTAVNNIVALGGVIPVLFFTQSLGLVQYMMVETGIWVVGLSAAVIWVIYGTETGQGRSVRMWERSKSSATEEVSVSHQELDENTL